MSLILSWVVCGLWAVLSIPSLIFMLRNSLNHTPPTEFSNRPASEGNPAPPKVSIIVPARDEAAAIEQNLLSLLKSDYPNFEIVAVNDRSQDETGRLMDQVAASHDNVKVIHVTELPAGWLGKNHAMHVAADEASGDWLLFTDGDVIFDPSALSRGIRYVETNKVDHLCIMPTMILGSLLEGILVAGFALCFAVGVQPILVKTKFPFSYFGIGAFNLIRQSVFESFGGFNKIRFDVLDDVKLGKLVKQNGYQQMVLRNENLVAVKWQENAWGVICGLEKNGFAATEYSLARGIAGSLLLLTLFFGPYVGALLTTGSTQLGYVVTVLMMHTLFASLGQMLGSSVCVFPFLPVAVLGIVFAYCRSAWKTLRQGGVYWRETYYSLKELKAGLYRK